MNRHHLIFILALVCLQLSLNSCIEIIDFETDRTSNQLVVDGQISNDEGPYFLRLGKTTNEGSATRPVTGASITLHDQQNNREPYVEIGNGRYIMLGHRIDFEMGGTYYIEITLEDGSTYRSRPEEIPSTTGSLDSLYYEVTTQEQYNDSGSLVEEDVIKVFSDTNIPDMGNPLYLRWKLEEVYSFKEFIRPGPLAPPAKVCFITQFSNPQNVLLYNSTESETQRITDQLLATSVINHTFYRRHFFNAILYSTTRQAYEYWNEVDQVVNSGGTIFDVPPATPAGNIYNIDDESEQVLGYFEASLADTLRFYTQRYDFDKFIPNPCGRRQDTFSRPSCLDCLDIPSSRLEQPFYWLGDYRAGNHSDYLIKASIESF